jgi:hypothetical protein
MLVHNIGAYLSTTNCTIQYCLNIYSCCPKLAIVVSMYQNQQRTNPKPWELALLPSSRLD